MDHSVCKACMCILCEWNEQLCEWMHIYISSPDVWESWHLWAWIAWPCNIRRIRTSSSTVSILVLTLSLLTRTVLWYYQLKQLRRRVGRYYPPACHTSLCLRYLRGSKEDRSCPPWVWVTFKSNITLKPWPSLRQVEGECSVPSPVSAAYLHV